MSVSEWFENNRLVRRAVNVCRRWRKAFLHLYLYAAVIYLPLIVLRLTNFLDGMWDQDDHLAGAAELRIGRWFWPWLDRLRFGVSLDPLPAIVSIALFVAGVLIILGLMRKAGPTESVQLSLTEYLAGALMLTTPAVLSQLSYSYMSITFSTSFLLAVLAVWVIAVPCEKAADRVGRPDGSKGNLPTGNVAVSSADVQDDRPDGGAAANRADQFDRNMAGGQKKRLLSAAVCGQIGWILLSAFLIALMMGLYQASLGVLCITALAYFIFQLDGACGGKKCCIRKGLRFALRMLLALVIGAVLYEFLLQIHLTVMGETLSDYKGASSAGLTGMISVLPSSIMHCWSAFKAYFIHNLFAFNALQGETLFYLLYLVPALGAVLYAVKLLRSGGGAVGKFVLLILAALLIPVFANSFFLLATESDTAVQMTGGMSLVIPLLLLAWDHVDLPSNNRNGQSCPRGKLAAWALGAAFALSGFLLLYGSIGQMAIDQYAMYVGRQATTTLAKSVLNEFTVYGVDYDYNVVLVYGAPADSPTFAVGDLYWEANLYAQYGNWGNDEETNRLCWGHFFDQQLRVSMNYAEDETLHTIMTSEEVAAMTVFPASGSVQNVWGVTVVKVAE